MNSEQCSWIPTSQCTSPLEYKGIINLLAVSRGYLHEGNSQELERRSGKIFALDGSELLESSSVRPCLLRHSQTTPLLGDGPRLFGQELKQMAPAIYSGGVVLQQVAFFGDVMELVHQFTEIAFGVWINQRYPR